MQNLRNIPHEDGQVAALIRYLQWLAAEEKKTKELIRKIHEADNSNASKVRKA